MAIKAIINNTEKEIEQIKNNNEQDIDYVYSRIGDTEVEGEPPISIKSIGGNLADYRIYGNTAGGESVGDRTGNLFDGELAQGYYKDTAGSSNDLISTNLRVAGTSFIPVSAGNKMTLSYESTIDITRYLVYYYNNNKELINVMGWYNNGFTITIPDNVSFIRHVWCARDQGTYGTILVADISNIMLNMGSTALPYEPYGYKVPVTVSNGTDTQTTPIYLPEQIKMVGDEAEYIDYKEQKQHFADGTSIDVALPALPTIKGTNTLSVNTSIQPSNIYIKDNFDYKKVFTATRTIEGESPLNYRSIEDSDSTLKNYRIYGQTVDGESVGDRTGNLFDGELTDGYHLSDPTGLPVSYAHRFATLQAIIINQDEYCLTYNSTTDLRFMYSVFNNDTLIRRVSRTNGRYLQSGDVIDTTNGNKIYFAFYKNDQEHASTGMISNIMLNTGSTPLPYEPYGYKVPVTVSNGTDAQTIPIYLSEQIRKVGDEAEYIDYAEQKMHRVRKNLLQNTSGSSTIFGVTYTVNDDGSITCNTDENGATRDSFYYPIDITLPSFAGKTIILSGGTTNIYVRAYHYQGNNTISSNGNDTKPFTMEQGFIDIYVPIGTVLNNVTIFPMARLASIEDDTYEPYIENTDLDVNLLALPTLAGTSVLSVGTEVQPSGVEIKGHIK